MKYLFLFILLIGSCGPQFIKDPNAYVEVTSQYEDEPEKLVSSSVCSESSDGKVMSQAECAVSLYASSENFLNSGKDLIKKKLYVSAQSQLRRAISLLIEARMRLKRAKIENFDDYKILTHFKLEKKINERIKLCERLIRAVMWER